MGERAADFFRLMSARPAARLGRIRRGRSCSCASAIAPTTSTPRSGTPHRFGALEHAAVERILAARATPRTLDEYVAEDTARRIEQTLGNARTEPRDLTEYDRLPLASPRRRPTPPHGDDLMPKRSARPQTLTTERTGDDRRRLERLRRHLEFLGLTHTLAELDEHLAWATRERPGATALLEHVLGAEAAQKLEQAHRRVASTRSGLIETQDPRGLRLGLPAEASTRPLVLELARLDFVRRHDDLVITGKSGTGKSHILKAFALRACEQGIRMRYARCVDLLDDLHAGLADGTYRAATQGLGAPRPARSSTTSASARSRSATTSRPPPTRSTTSSIAGTAASRPPSPPTSRSATGAATSATPRSPPPSSTASRCTPSASTSTARAIASTSRRPAAASPSP